MSHIVRAEVRGISPAGEVTEFFATLDTGATLRIWRYGPNADRYEEADSVWWYDWPEDCQRPMRLSATRMFEREADRAENAAHDCRR